MTFFFGGIDPAWRERAAVVNLTHIVISTSTPYFLSSLAPAFFPSRRRNVGDYNLGVFRLHLCLTIVAC